MSTYKGGIVCYLLLQINLSDNINIIKKFNSFVYE